MEAGDQEVILILPVANPLRDPFFSRKMESHEQCTRESPFSKFPTHTFCKQLEGDDNGTILKYKWNHDLLCLVNQTVEGECNLVVVYDYSSKPGSVFHFTSTNEAVAYLELFFRAKAVAM